MNKCPHLLPLEGAPASIFDHLHHSIPFQSNHTFRRTDGYVFAACMYFCPALPFRNILEVGIRGFRKRDIVSGQEALFLHCHRHWLQCNNSIINKYLGSHDLIKKRQLFQFLWSISRFLSMIGEVKIWSFIRRFGFIGDFCIHACNHPFPMAVHIGLSCNEHRTLYTF